MCSTTPLLVLGREKQPHHQRWDGTKKEPTPLEAQIPFLCLVISFYVFLLYPNGIKASKPVSLFCFVFSFYEPPLCHVKLTMSKEIVLKIVILSNTSITKIVSEAWVPLPRMLKFLWDAGTLNLNYFLIFLFSSMTLSSMTLLTGAKWGDATVSTLSALSWSHGAFVWQLLRLSAPCLAQSWKKA